MKVFVSLLWLLFVTPCFAQQATAPVETPIVSFAQQVDIVVTAKRNRNLLDMKFHQDKDDITLEIIVGRDTDAAHAKDIALHVVMLAKSKSLDDPPKKKDEPGKGIYDYHVNITSPDGVTLVTAIKEKTKEKLSFEDPFQVEPLTRADEGGR